MLRVHFYNLFTFSSTMSDLEALLTFNKKPVSIDMVHFLAATTSSVIQVKENVAGSVVSLVDFIKGLIKHSNVQTPTLMSTVVYLTRLRSIIPATVYGIETTRHRIFLGCLILAAKNLNDSSPLNKHWSRYTNGLLDIREVNTIERELLEYFDWKLRIDTQDLVTCLSSFLKPIKDQITYQRQQDLLLFNAPLHGKTRYCVQDDHHSRSSSNMSIPSLVSSATSSTISTADSFRQPNNYHRKIYSISEKPVERPVLYASINKQPMTIQEESPSLPLKLHGSGPNVHNSGPTSSHITSFPSSGVHYTTNAEAKQQMAARPIILQSGLDKPINNTSCSGKFGLRKSSWATIFK